MVARMSTSHARAGGRPSPVLAVLATLTVLLTGAALLAQQGAVVVHQCVSAGAFGRLGVGLSLLRTDAACPAGQLGVGDGRRVVGLVVAIAAPVLLAHLAGALLGVGAVARLHRALRALVVAVRALPRVAGPVGVPVVAPRPGAVDVPVRRPRARAVPHGQWWRGPPEVGLA